MWKIFQEEFLKIASRKIVWIGLFCLLAFVRYRIAGPLQEEYCVTVDGETIYGKEALEKDKELTARYAGPLTEEKVREIYGQYGFCSHNSETGERKGNFCSHFITEHMTNAPQDGYGDPEQIRFLEGEEWERNAAIYLNGNVRFDYVYGWSDLRETYGMVVILGLAVLSIIGLSPVFSEEYALKTADILLTTRRGKKSGIWMKAAAAISFVLLLFIAVTAYVWLLYIKVFGIQGLDASPVLIGGGYPGFGYCTKTIAGFFLFLFGLGLAGFLLLTAMTLAASALCRNAFLTVVVSLAIFLIPVVWLKVLAPMCILGIDMTRTVSHFMVSMPFYLFLNWDFMFSVKKIAMHLAIALAVGTASVWLGYRTYRGYQG